MKQILIKSAVIIIIFAFSGCSSSVYYQMYTTKSSELEEKQSKHIYENDEVKISYNFWTNYGVSSFLFFNKTDRNIYIDLQNTHLIINNIAYTYYQTTDSRTNISSSIICIPPHSAKNIDGFYFKKEIYRNCELFIYPSNNTKIVTTTFSESESPFLITNSISYGFTRNDFSNNVIINNDFWVSEITNYPSTQFIESKYKDFCNEKSVYYEDHYIYKNSQRFYIKYKKSMTNDLDY